MRTAGTSPASLRSSSRYSDAGQEACIDLVYGRIELAPSRITANSFTEIGIPLRGKLLRRAGNGSVRIYASAFAVGQAWMSYNSAELLRGMLPNSRGPNRNLHPPAEAEQWRLLRILW